MKKQIGEQQVLIREAQKLKVALPVTEALQISNNLFLNILDFINDVSFKLSFIMIMQVILFLLLVVGNKI